MEIKLIPMTSRWADSDTTWGAPDHAADATEETRTKNTVSSVHIFSVFFMGTSFLADKKSVGTCSGEMQPLCHTKKIVYSILFQSVKKQSASTGFSNHQKLGA